MLKETDPNYDIIEITDNWLPLNYKNDDINEGKIEWFIRLKDKINFNQLNHIGGNNFSNLINFMDLNYLW